ncbi:MAG: response regulator transcription factor [Pseudomonadota bacterium]
MQLYVHEPRSERMAGLCTELANAGFALVSIDEAFFRRDLSLLTREDTMAAGFLLAETDQLAEQIDALRSAACAHPIVVMRDFRSAAAAAQSINLGADQDMVIPIKGFELKARINATIRRAKGHITKEVRVGAVTAFLDGRDPEIDGSRVRLSSKEHEIFQQLALNAGRVVSKAAIYDSVYAVAEVPPFDKVVDVYICKIRKKFDAVTKTGSAYIETVPGRGYRLSADAFDRQQATTR